MFINEKKAVINSSTGLSFSGVSIREIILFENMQMGVVKACAMASFCVESFGVNNIINKNPQEIHDRVKILQQTTSIN